MDAVQAKKWIRWCAVGLLIGVGGMVLGYALFGHTLVKVLYKGATGTFLDRIIGGQEFHSIGHYYGVVDRGVRKAAVSLCLLAWVLLIISLFSSTRLLVALLSTDMLFILLGVIHGSASAALDSNFRLSKEWGYAETFQYTKEFGILVCFFLFFVRHLHPICLGWQTCFLYILLDDSWQIHERLGKFLGQYLPTSTLPGIRARDLGELLVSLSFGSIILSLVGIGYYYADGTLRKISQVLFGLLAVTVLFGVILDLGGRIISHYSVLVGDIFYVVEEGGEMAAVSMIAWYVHRLMNKFNT
jgi:hypothetical protein